MSRNRGTEPIDPTVNTQVTHGIRISVRSLFVPEQSSALNFSYVFAYRVHIKNESDQTVQLLSRHWDIRDAWGEYRVVEGEGVVGQQPILAPGEEHSYVSGSVFKTPVGVMEGWYTMVSLTADGPVHAPFDVTIPPFQLIVPFALN